MQSLTIIPRFHALCASQFRELVEDSLFGLTDNSYSMPPCWTYASDVMMLRQKNVDEALRELREAGIEAVGCAANVGSKSDLKKLVDLAVEAYGTVDVLVSNAAVNPAAGLILDMPDSAIEKILDVNIKSAILLAKEVRPHLRKVNMPSAVQNCALTGFFIPFRTQI